jgi:ATP-dependent RNA helicase MSS116
LFSTVEKFGTPESKEQYIHRLGRTGRAGKKGKGILVLSPFERAFLGELSGHDIPVDTETKDMLEAPLDPEIQEKLDTIKARTRSGDAILTTSAQQGYQAFLGYYLSNMKRLRIKSKQDLVQYANAFAALTGLRDTPLLEKRLVGKMGLSGIPGISIGSYKNPNGSTEKKGTQGHADGRKSPHKKERRS